MIFQTEQPTAARVRTVAENREYIYKTVSGKGLPMKVYLPNNTNYLMEKQEYCFLMIHGGAWQAVHRSDKSWDGSFLNYQAKYYAARGFGTAAISYRSIDFDASTTVRELIDDCRDAVCFLQALFHPRHLILIGDSAGAHLALSLALQNVPGISAVVAANPVLDCTPERWHFTAPSHRERLQLSPLYQIQHISAKIFCLHGDADPVVDYRQTEEFCEKMKKAGNHCDFCLIPGALHAFLLMDYRSSEDEVQHYMSLIDQWLDAQF